MSSAETSTSLNEFVQAGSVVGSAPAWSELPANTIAPIMSAGLPLDGPLGFLPRGVYNYDAGSASWVKTDDSDDLELNWVADTVAYSILIDWNANGATVMVDGAFNARSETPTGARAEAHRAGVEVGALEFASSWTQNQCGYDEPTAVSLNGYLGSDAAKLSLDELSFSLSDTATLDTIGATASASATVDGDSLSVDFDVNARGELERDADCNIVDFALQDGSLTAGAAASVDGEQSSIRFTTAFSGLRYESGMMVGIDLTGDLRMNGALALAFSGELNDANANGVPGDDLVLTFAGDETMSLEEFLIDEIGWAPLAALRLLMR